MPSADVQPKVNQYQKKSRPAGTGTTNKLNQKPKIKIMEKKTVL